MGRRKQVEEPDPVAEDSWEDDSEYDSDAESDLSGDVPEGLVGKLYRSMEQRRETEPAVAAQQEVILESVLEALTEAGESVTGTSLFVSVVQTLEAAYGGREEANTLVAALLGILVDILDSVNTALLRPKVDGLLAMFNQIIHENREQAEIVLHSMGCIHATLFHATIPALKDNGSSAFESLRTLAALCADTRHKVHNMAIWCFVHSVTTAAAEDDEKRVEVLAKLLSTELKLAAVDASKSDKDVPRCLHLLKIMEGAIKLFPSGVVVEVTKTLLKMPRSGQAPLIRSAFNVLESMFVEKSSAAIGEADDDILARLGGLAKCPLSDTAVNSLLRALEGMEPSVKDCQTFAAYSGAFIAAFLHFAKANAGAGQRMLPDIFRAQFDKLCNSFVATAPAAKPVRSALVQAIIRLIRDVITTDSIEAVLSETATGTEQAPVLRVIETMKEGLRYKYRSSWPTILMLFRTLIGRLGALGVRKLLPDVLAQVGTMVEFEEEAGLGAMMDDERSDANTGAETVRKLAKAVVGNAVVVCGPMNVCAMLPLNLTEGEPNRSWMLGILKEYAPRSPHTNLQSFVKIVLSTITAVEKSLSAARSEGSEVKVKYLSTTITQLWALWPAFASASGAVDDVETVFPQFAKHIGMHLKVNGDDMADDADRVALETAQASICQGLHSLVRNGMVDGEPAPSISKGVGRFAKNFLQILLDAAQRVHSKDFLRDAMTDAIEAICSVSDPAHVNNSFHTVMGLIIRLAEEGLVANKRVVEALFGFVVVVVGYLSQESVQILWKVVESILCDEAVPSKLQKRAYRAVDAALAKKHAFLNLPAVTATLLGPNVSESCHIASRRLRLRCIHQLLFMHQLQRSDAAVAPVLGECLLYAKDANEHTRSAAFHTAVDLAKFMLDIDTSAPFRRFVDEAQAQRFLDVVKVCLAGLAGRSTVMISGTVLVVSRLVHEFRSAIRHALRRSGEMETEKETEMEMAGESSSVLSGPFHELLDNMLVLMRHESREVVRAVFSFLKACIATLPLDVYIRPRLHAVVECLLLQTKGSCSGALLVQVKHVLERLMRKFGYDSVLEAAGGDECSDLKLLKYVKKMFERRVRKAEARREARNAGDDDKLHEFMKAMRALGDAAVPGEGVDFASKQRDLGRIRIQETGRQSGDVQDLLDSSMASRLVAASKKRSRNNGGESDDDGDGDAITFERDESGKLIVNEEEEEGERERERAGGKRRKTEMTEVEKQVAQVDPKSLLGRRWKEKEERRRREMSDIQRGDQFRSRKKAGGDRKTGGMDPFAYVPLNPKFVTKRHRAKAGKRFAAVDPKAASKKR